MYIIKAQVYQVEFGTCKQLFLCNESPWEFLFNIYFRKTPSSTESTTVFESLMHFTRDMLLIRSWFYILRRYCVEMHLLKYKN